MKKRWEDVDKMLPFSGLPYVPKIICTELISRYHNDLLAGPFGIKKTRELIAQKYYWPTLHHNVDAYVKSCDVCLAIKAVRHKPYGNRLSLSMPKHCWKNLSIDFVTGLSNSTN